MLTLFFSVHSNGFTTHVLGSQLLQKGNGTAQLVRPTCHVERKNNHVIFFTTTTTTTTTKYCNNLLILILKKFKTACNV